MASFSLSLLCGAPFLPPSPNVTNSFSISDVLRKQTEPDAEEAGAVIQYDDVVDRCFDTVKSELIDRLKSDASCREDVVDILMIAKYLERIGDHAVNVAKWALFSLTGEWEE